MIQYIAGRLAAMLLSSAVLFGTGCATTGDVVIVNRTEALLVVAPGIEVQHVHPEPTSAPSSRELAKELVKRVLDDDMSWVPDGAVFPEGGVPGSRNGAPKPMNYVSSSSAPPTVVDGTIRSEDLPGCDGTPDLG
ncbi:MAG TPA: hypothetical protein VFJ80_03185 [Candidatus Limnocylindrales bacterium]|jgi:hypothetical protein|nr:hypothetical protein [Candidatus Limnocylindrales bacterium]